ncbi:hypothetical protein F0562_025316 [Nyssa sinensis]|uniref:Uncharacterized protein n=1 Tax=Nyssa sinensis TaxID=561372 RepID=A0A5J5BDX5_9ASTE|nr:hypothetical protein F0562_025316 [Nyssa sinensis]
MAIVTGDRYLESLVKFVDKQAGQLIEGTLVLKLNPVGLHYVQSRLEALNELESLLTGAPVDYLRAYVSDLGDHRAIEQLRRILRLLTSLKVVSVLPQPARDPTPLSLLPFGRLKVLELRGCDLSTSAARGLLELRHTLEKIICHDSTDALRHVFASRIAEIKNSPQWNRLSFVSCACNGLVLMDESLQLLPVVDTLDLSRNKFTKVDNLRKCNKLKHLDLGFNHLRTIASFSEVSCQIVKLVLRNNALTTLHGIENLKSLEGLDLSYNIISNFSELEILAGLPSLKSLWLEGNPLCCARWYRSQVFSFFPRPDKVKLDEKQICKSEFWERQIIIASRQKRPASFGFYSPAKDDTEFEGTIDTKRKKLSRLALIECEEQSTNICLDQESVSCDIEIQSKEENAISDEEGEIVGLMNRIEVMKKEHSVLWLQEFKEWMNQASEDVMNRAILNPSKENYLKDKIKHKHLGESSRYVSDSVHASGDESSTNILESDNSFADAAGSNSHQYFDRLGEATSKFFMGHTSVNSVPMVERMDPEQENLKSYSNEEFLSKKARNLNPESFAAAGGCRMDARNSVTSLTVIDDIMESHSSSACPGSPPRYEEDILHRRHNLEEEFLQLSAESYSVASSDSNTSYSEEECTEFGPLIPQVDWSLIEEFSEKSVDGHSSVLLSEDTYYDKKHEGSEVTQNGFCAERNSGTLQLVGPDCSLQLWGNDFPAGGGDGEIAHFVKQEADWLEKKRCKRKPKRRVISLLEEYNMDDKTEPSQRLNGDLHICRDVEDEQGKQDYHGIDSQKSIDEKYTCKNAIASTLTNGSRILSRTKSSCLRIDDVIEDYLNSNVAEFGVQETCRQYVLCNCIFEQKPGYREREVALLLSSKHKLYVLLIDATHDGSGTSLRLMGCHKIEDVREVLVGLGLQVVRMYIEKTATYLFITRSIEKSRQLLCILNFFDSYAIKDNCSLRSLEQVQVDSFERHVCGGSKVSMFQYSMVLFWCNNMEEDIWLSRSLFVLGEQLLVCIEDFMQFGPLSEDASSSPYFLLDSCCAIIDVSEMIIEPGEIWCVNLTIASSASEFFPPDKAVKAKEKPGSGPVTWKLKWFSKDSLFNFVALLKAIHAGRTTSPLIVRCIS